MDCLENIFDSVLIEILLVLEPNIMMRNVIGHKDFWGYNTFFSIFMAHSDTGRLSYAILDLIKEELIFDIKISWMSQCDIIRELLIEWGINKELILH